MEDTGGSAGIQENTGRQRYQTLRRRALHETLPRTMGIQNPHASDRSNTAKRPTILWRVSRPTTAARDTL